MPDYVLYTHHGMPVHVREDLKGKHRDHCLCHNCALFNPDDREHNCDIANLLYAVCCSFNIVTPVWECPDFVKKEPDA